MAFFAWGLVAETKKYDFKLGPFFETEKVSVEYMRKMIEKAVVKSGDKTKPSEFINMALIFVDDEDTACADVDPYDFWPMPDDNNVEKFVNLKEGENI